MREAIKRWWTERVWQPVPALVFLASITWTVMRWEYSGPPLQIGLLAFVILVVLYPKVSRFLPSTSDVRPELFALIGCCTVVLMQHGFGKTFPGTAFRTEPGPAGWLQGAVLWSLAFVIYCAYHMLPGVKKEKIGCVAIFLIGVAVGLALVVVGVLFHYPFSHIYLAMLVGALFTVIEGIVFCSHTDERRRRRAIQLLLYADLPMAFTFIVLACYLWFSHAAADPESFVSGAIAFQLVSANLVVALIEAGVLEERSNP